MPGLLFLILLIPSLLSAQELTGKDIIKKMDGLMRGETSQGLYEMTITTPNWDRTLRLMAWEKSREKTFIRILAPLKERGTATLRIGYEMWNYLPSVERVIKIPPSMMLQSWMGSDFTNDDLVKESSVVNDYVHANLGKEAIDGGTAYRVEAIPKEDAPVVWGKIIFWVRVKGFVPLREEFYDERGELIRVLTFSEVKELGGRTIPARWEMASVKKKGRRTVFRILDVEFDKDIPESVFTHGNMRAKEIERR